MAYRRILFVTLLVLTMATVTLTAAAQENAGNLSGKITFLVWGNARSDEINREVIAAFNAHYPNIEVELISSAGENHYEKTLTMIAAGTPPDVVWTNAYDYSGFVARGLATDLTDWAARDGIRGELYQPSFWDEMVVDGRLYSIANIGAGRTVTYYNAQKFDEAGVADPYTGDWDWDHLVQAGRLLTRDHNGDGIADTWGIGNIQRAFWPWVWMNGGRLLNEDRTKATFDEEATYDAIQWLADLGNERGILGGNFGQGTAAMDFTWDTGVMNYRDSLSFDWDIAPLPAGRVEQVTTAKGNEIVIPYNAENKELAWEFAKFLGGEEAQYRYGQLGRFFPAQLDAARRLIDDHRRAGSQPPHYGSLIEFNARPLPLIPGWNEIQDMWLDELSAVWEGNVSARDAGIRIAERSEAILAEWQERLGTQ